jgi:hypothetical protein
MGDLNPSCFESLGSRLAVLDDGSFQYWQVLQDINDVETASAPLTHFHSRTTFFTPTAYSALPYVFSRFFCSLIAL